MARAKASKGPRSISLSERVKIASQEYRRRHDVPMRAAFEEFRDGLKTEFFKVDRGGAGAWCLTVDGERQMHRESLMAWLRRGWVRLVDHERHPTLETRVVDVYEVEVEWNL